MRQKLVYENRSRLCQVCGNMLYVSHNESLCVHLPVLSVSGDFYCHLPILYLSSHTHWQAHGVLLCPNGHPNKHQSVTHLHSPRCWRFCRVEIICSPANLELAAQLLSAWLKLTYSILQAQCWLKWHSSFFTFTFIFTFPMFFSDTCLILKQWVTGEWNSLIGAVHACARIAGQRSQDSHLHFIAAIKNTVSQSIRHERERRWIFLHASVCMSICTCISWWNSWFHYFIGE